ncbi:hypothetical protein BH09SUM1_BH09SUM1_04810 [soil metagenome]
MDEYKILKVEAVLGRGCFYEFEDDQGNKKTASSTNLVIVAALSAAIVSHATVPLDFDGVFIKRVGAFGIGANPSSPTSGAYQVSRLATQRFPDGQDFVEAFIKGDPLEPEMAYRVYDTFLQATLVAAFYPSKYIDLDFYNSNSEILRATLTLT